MPDRLLGGGRQAIRFCKALGTRKTVTKASWIPRILMMKTPKIGCVFEMPVNAGYAYGQYVFHHSERGALVGIYDSTFTSHLRSGVALAGIPFRFVVHFPVRAAARQGWIQLIDELPVPREYESYPKLRNGFPDKNGKVHKWWINDGNRDVPVSNALDVKYLSELRTVDIGYLEQLINEGWIPEKEWLDTRP